MNKPMASRYLVLMGYKINPRSMARKLAQAAGGALVMIAGAAIWAYALFFWATNPW